MPPSAAVAEETAIICANGSLCGNKLFPRDADDFSRPTNYPRATIDVPTPRPPERELSKCSTVGQRFNLPIERQPLGHLRSPRRRTRLHAIWPTSQILRSSALPPRSPLLTHPSSLSISLRFILMPARICLFINRQVQAKAPLRTLGCSVLARNTGKGDTQRGPWEGGRSETSRLGNSRPLMTVSYVPEGSSARV